jgi:hypothetical protein
MRLTAGATILARKASRTIDFTRASAERSLKHSFNSNGRMVAAFPCLTNLFGRLTCK